MNQQQQQHDNEDAGCFSFCGRNPIESIITNDSVERSRWSACEACHWGSRSDTAGYCRPCDQPLSIYDWYYLGFMFLLPMLIQSFFIEYYSRSRTRIRRWLMAEHGCVAIECILSGAFALFVIPPIGFRLYRCDSRGLRDWYTMFYNPVIKYSHTIRCTHEAVYPIYSLPFIYLAFCLLSLATIRSAVMFSLQHRLSGPTVSRPIYAALYVFPIIALVHALFAGLIYYSFGYILLIQSLAGSALYLALLGCATIRELVDEIRSNGRHLVVIATLMTLFGYSIVAISAQLDDTLTIIESLYRLALVPAPILFFVLTVGVTHPNKLMSTE